MPKIFGSATKNLPANERHFKHVFIHAISNETEFILPDNSFGGITFDSFSGYNINKISLNAFNNSVNKIENFYCRQCLLEMDSTKNLINQMHQLKILDVELNTTEIPSNAFSSGGNHTELRFLDIMETHHNLTVKSGAFQHLNELDGITFKHTSISAIENQAFKLNLTSSKTSKLYITFDWCNITGGIFKNGSFDGHNDRPLSVGFTVTDIDYLDERIFKTVFKNENSTIYFYFSSLDCFDCRNYWLAKDYNATRVHSTRCNGQQGKNLFDEEIKTKLDQKCKKL